VPPDASQRCRSDRDMLSRENGGYAVAYVSTLLHGQILPWGAAAPTGQETSLKGYAGPQPALRRRAGRNRHSAGNDLLLRRAC